jgi:hypothetical protein
VTRRGRPPFIRSEKVAQARDLACSGLNAGEIAKRTGLSRRYVKDLIEDTQRRVDARPVPAIFDEAIDLARESGEGLERAIDMKEIWQLLATARK